MVEWKGVKMKRGVIIGREVRLFLLNWRKKESKTHTEEDRGLVLTLSHTPREGETVKRDQANP